MELNVTATEALKSASTPEEAFQVFAGAVSDALPGLLADAIGKALGAAMQATTTNSSIQGWESNFMGLSLGGKWGNPSKAPQIEKLCWANVMMPAGSKLRISGGSLTVGGTWTF